MITTIALFAIAGNVFFRHREVDFVLFLTFIRYTLVQALSILLPLSLLIAVVFVYGRAAADHEITTLKASGVHPYRMIWPGALLALLLCAVTLEVENSWAPWAMHQMSVLPQQEGTIKALLEKRIAADERAVDFGDKEVQRKLFWESAEMVATGGIVLNHVLLESTVRRKEGDPRPPETTHLRADRAVVRFDERHDRVVLRLEEWRMLSGVVEGAKQEALVLTFDFERDDDRTRLKLQSLGELFTLAARGRETVALGGAPLSLLRYYSVAEVEGRIHQRLARAATPLLFLLLGVPLALVFRSGNRLIAFLLASLIAMFVYYPSERLGNVLMTEQLVGPVLACWSGSLLLVAIGGGLLAFVVRR